MLPYIHMIGQISSRKSKGANQNRARSRAFIKLRKSRKVIWAGTCLCCCAWSISLSETGSESPQMII